MSHNATTEGPGGSHTPFFWEAPSAAVLALPLGFLSSNLSSSPGVMSPEPRPGPLLGLTLSEGLNKGSSEAHLPGAGTTSLWAQPLAWSGPREGLPSSCCMSAGPLPIHPLSMLRHPRHFVHPHQCTPFPALNLVLPGGMVTPAAPLSGHPQLTWDLDGASGSGDMTPTSTPCGRAPSLPLEVGMTSAETFPVHGF